MRIFMVLFMGAFSTGWKVAEHRAGSFRSIAVDVTIRQKVEGNFRMRRDA
jgi:hypothetical protein